MSIAGLTLVFVVLAADKGAPAFPEKFCAAWKKASQQPPRQKEPLDYRDAVGAAVRQVERDATGEWRDAMRILPQTGEADHLAILRDAAKRTGTSFECEAFEFPAGRPTGTKLLSTADLGIQALAADDTGLYWFGCSYGRTRECRLQRLEGGAAKVVAAGLPEPNTHPQLLLDGNDALLVLRDSIVAVPKAGGAPKSLAGKLSYPHSLTLDGDSLLYADADEIRRMPRAGGPATLLFKGKVQTAGSTEPEVLLPAGKTLLFNTWEGPLFRAFTPELAKPMATAETVYDPVVLGGVLHYLRGYPTHILSRYDATSDKMTEIIEAPDTYSLVATRGELVGVNGPPWPGKRRVVRWKQGAKKFEPIATGVGEVRLLAGDAKQLYWVDAFHQALMAAPR